MTTQLEEVKPRQIQEQQLTTNRTELENYKITSNSGMLGVSWSLGETNPANCKDVSTVSSRQCDCGVPQIRLRTYSSVNKALAVSVVSFTN